MNVKRKATSSISAAVGSPSAPKRLKQGSLTTFFGPPPGSKTLSTSAKIAFDKGAWIDTLTPPQRELLKYRPPVTCGSRLIGRLEIETLDDSWLAVLKDELTKPYFLKVSNSSPSSTKLKIS